VSSHTCSHMDSLQRSKRLAIPRFFMLKVCNYASCLPSRPPTGDFPPATAPRPTAYPTVCPFGY
jgi:hypothetical protein